MAPKHLTSSVFVFGRFTDGWRTGLIRHPRLHRMMIPGGHVEPEESSAEAALREVAEETGLAVTLVSPPAAPVPDGYRGRRVAPPWWIAEYQVMPDNHLGVAHVHVDHLYVALADGTPRLRPERACPMRRTRSAGTQPVNCPALTCSTTPGSSRGCCWRAWPAARTARMPDRTRRRRLWWRGSGSPPRTRPA